MYTEINLKNVVFQLSLQPPAQAGSSLADFSTLKMEAIRSSETLIHTRSTRRHIQQNDILHSQRRENLRSYKILTGLNIIGINFNQLSEQ
jgi:hypothetical protein